MASTYSDLKFELIGTGDQSGTWGTTTNTNIGTAVEQAIVGMATLTSANFTANVATLTLTNTNAVQNARALCLVISAASLTAAGTLNVPAIQKPYLIINNDSFAITVKVTALTGVSVPAGKRTVVYNNGTDVGNQIDYLSTLALGTALPVTSGGTGSTSTTFVNLATNVTGTLPVVNGGTGVTSSTGTGNVVLSTSPTLVTPALGTPSALVGTNITGTASGLTAGTVTTNANLTGDVTSVGNATTLTNAPVIAKVLTGYVSGAGTVAATDSILQAIQKLNGNDATNANLTGAVTSVGNATSLGSFTSAQLATALTDETGSGSAVFATSPTLVTPVLGTPTSGNLANCTFPTLNQNTTGTAAGLSATLAVASGGTGVITSTGTGSVVLSTSPTLVTPLLGTPTSGNLANCTFPTLNQNTTGTAAGLSATLAVASGGTGTATPALVAGTNITLSGTWPNQTINSSNTGGSVTSVAALTLGTSGTDLSSTVATATTTPVITLNVPTASASNRGALSAADWTTFNNKQASGSYVTVGGALGTPSSGTLTNCTFPTLNQNTTGTAAGLSSILAVLSGGTGTATPALVAGTNITITGTWPNQTVNSSSGGGTVTSVTGTAPVASSGGATPAISLSSGYGDTLNPYASKTANFVLAAPTGVAGVPTFRAVVAADIPTLNQNTTGTAAGLSTTLAVASGGTGVTVSTGTGSVVLSTSPTLVTPLLGTPTSGNLANCTFPTLNQNTTGTAAGLSSTLAVASGGSGQTSYTNGQLLIGNTTGNTLTKTTLTAGSGISITNGNGSISIDATNAGVVTSVTGTAPVASSGGTTPAISLSAAYGDTLNPYASKTANFVLAAPTGTAGVPTFRAVVAADIPTLNQNTTGTAAGLSATLAVASGGTGVTTSTGSGNNVLSTSPTLVTPLLGTPTSGVATNLTGLPLTTGVTGTLPAANGGTGVANNAAMTVTGSGNFAYTRTLTGTTNVTFPTTGTLATLAGSETLTNKTLTSPTLTTPALGTPASGILSSCTVDGTDKVGFLNIPQNSQSAAYTLVLADAGKHIFHPSTDANARTYTIPANSSVAYPIGTAITFINMTSQVVTIAITTDTMYLSSAGTTGSRSLAQYGSATAIKMTTTTWLISGSGLT